MADFQRDQDVIAYESFTGVRNDVSPERFALTDLVAGRNIDIDESGRASRRTGRTLKHAGLVHSLWAKDALCLFAEGDALKRLNADYTSAVLRSGLTPLAPLSYQAVNDQVYYANGVESGVVERGVSRSWGIPVPPLPSVAVTVGAMPAGDYQFAVTYLRADGQESGAGLAGRIYVPDGSGLNFILPVPVDQGIVSKNIYLSTTNGEELYHTMLVGASVLTATYQNDTSELALPLMTQFMGPPPAGNLLGYYHGRMYVAVGDILYYSEPYAYELFDLRRYIALDGRVTMFAPIEDRDNPGVLVGTDKSIGWMPGTNPDEFQYVPRADYGVIYGTMAYIDGAMYEDHRFGARQLPMFLTTAGLCIGLPGGEMQNITRSKYIFPAQGSGCALFKPDTTQFVAVANF